MKVFSFDTDLTLEPGNGEYDPLVPLETVAYLAHETEHVVWAHGNQILTEWVDVPGDEAAWDQFRERWGSPVERVDRRRHPEMDRLIEGEPAPPDPDIVRAMAEYERNRTRLARQQRLRLISSFYPDADEYICVDNEYLGFLAEWTHYSPPGFMEEFGELLELSEDYDLGEISTHPSDRVPVRALRRVGGVIPPSAMQVLPLRFNPRKRIPLEFDR